MKQISAKLGTNWDVPLPFTCNQAIDNSVGGLIRITVFSKIWDDAKRSGSDHVKFSQINGLYETP